MADFTFLADKAVFCTMLQKLSKCEVKTAQCEYFRIFFITQILREINFGECRRSDAKIHPNQNSEPLKVPKNDIFRMFKFSKI